MFVQCTNEDCLRQICALNELPGDANVAGYRGNQMVSFADLMMPHDVNLGHQEECMCIIL